MRQEASKDKLALYITANTILFISLTGKHNNLTILVLNFNRIKFNLSAIYDKEGF